MENIEREAELHTRNEILQMWHMQDSLLQQYRVMAITLLGLISAGVLVLISGLINEATGYGNTEIPYVYLSIIKILYVILLYLGIRGTLSFKKICKAREETVYFFANLQIMAESGVLSDRMRELGIEAPLPIFTILRERSVKLNQGKKSSSESTTIQNLIDICEADSRIRKGKTRKFLSSFLFIVFHLFFLVSSLFFIVYLVRIGASNYGSILSAASGLLA